MKKDLRYKLISIKRLIVSLYPQIATQFMGRIREIRVYGSIIWGSLIPFNTDQNH